jgi:hypothetical protein
MEEGIKMAAQVLQRFSADEEMFFRLMSEQKYEMDHYTAMAEAEERAWKRAEKAIAVEQQRAEKAEAAIAVEQQRAEKAEAAIEAERQSAETKRTAAIEELKAQGVSYEVLARIFDEN